MATTERSHPQLRALDAQTFTYQGWQEDFNKAEDYHVHRPILFDDKLAEMKRKQDIRDGERSHPQLQALDAQVFTYQGWQEDSNKAEDYHTQHPDLFDDKLAEMKKKQDMRNERSHPQLRALDAQEFTYQGWQEDFNEAEDFHVEDPADFDDKLAKMKRKQDMRNERSHPHLQALDAEEFTYQGWQEDFNEAEDCHVRYPIIFDDQLAEMKKKQDMRDGERSHPQLQALDAQAFTYQGWQEDFNEAEDHHVQHPTQFDDKLTEMKKKQAMRNERSHPQLQALDAQVFTYQGWQEDFNEAEDYHIQHPTIFDDQLAEMKKKQDIHDGERSHPQLRALDAQDFTYQGWQEDFNKAEDCHTQHPDLFDDKLAEMKKKQDMCNERSHPQLRALDAQEFTYQGWQEDSNEAEDFHVAHPILFDDKLAEMKRKQDMRNERSHPQLQALDAQEFTYQGWQEDFNEAENCHVEHLAGFDDKLAKMKRKQDMRNERSHPHLQALDAEEFTYQGWQEDFNEAEDCHVRYPIIFDDQLAEMKKKEQLTRRRQVTAAREPRRSNRRRSNNNNNVAQRQPKRTRVTTNCTVCLQHEPSHVFVPCGHLCICERCANDTLYNRRCSICRQEATRVMRVIS